VWVEGYWYPQGRHYQWRDGYWTRPPFANARWVGPRYDGRRYYDGYWDRGRAERRNDGDWNRDRRDGNRDSRDQDWQGRR
jgi:hypothetical protein